MQADVIVVGAGLAGLVAAAEAADRGRSVLLLDQEGEQNLGGQAFWSLGGLFLVDSPEQRRLGVRDSLTLARQDWFGSAQFDRPEDAWPRQWANAYLDFAAPTPVHLVQLSVGEGGAGARDGEDGTAGDVAPAATPVPGLVLTGHDPVTLAAEIAARAEEARVDPPVEGE